MKKSKNNYKIDEKFSKQLVEWFEKEQRILPWRQTDNPYHILVSEVMLQQTQVNTVIAYYLRFLEELPTLEALAQASDEQLHRLWEGLGYYSRVFRLRQFAVEVCSKYDGSIPQQKEQLLLLPGIGPYTCGALLSFAFHIKEPAIDGNVKRVLARLTNDSRDISKASTLKDMQETVYELMPKDPYAFNQGLIELGATHCRPRQPRCDLCPVKQFCHGYQQGTLEFLPNKPKKKKQKEMTVPVFLFHDNQEVLFVKRQSEGLLASMWSLPIVEVDLSHVIKEKKSIKAKEIIELATVQDFFSENFGQMLNPSTMTIVGPIKHVFSHIIWNMHVVIVKDQAFWNHVDKIESPEIIKTTIEEISLPTAFKKCVEFIQKKELI